MGADDQLCGACRAWWATHTVLEVAREMAMATLWVRWELAGGRRSALDAYAVTTAIREALGELRSERKLFGEVTPAQREELAHWLLANGPKEVRQRCMEGDVEPRETSFHREPVMVG